MTLTAACIPNCQKEKPAHEIGGLEDTDDHPGGEASTAIRKGYVHFLDIYRIGVCGLEKLSVNDVTQAEDGTWWIHIHRQKTDMLSSVRLLDIPLQIIEKYRSQRTGDKVFNVYNRGYFITLTRELGQVYGFDLTYHQARHNFGTHITLSLGVPIETVSRMMGHNSISTTQLYAQVTDTKVDEDMKRLKSTGFGKQIQLCEEDFIVKKNGEESLKWHKIT